MRTGPVERGAALNKTLSDDRWQALCTGEVSPGYAVGVLQMRNARKVSITQVSIHQIGARKVCRMKIGVTEVGISKRCSE
jgi:hypothetical protein